MVVFKILEWILIGIYVLAMLFLAIVLIVAGLDDRD